jgi:hypothetical protein
VLILVVAVFALMGCTDSAPTPPPAPTTASSRAQPSAALAKTPGPTKTSVARAQPILPSDPAWLGDDLVADERALRDTATPAPALTAAARRQQAAYRAIGRHSEWDAIIRPRIPTSLLQTYDLNVSCTR